MLCQANHRDQGLSTLCGNHCEAAEPTTRHDTASARYDNDCGPYQTFPTKSARAR